MDHISFLYRTVPGRLLLKVLAGRRVSQICGAFLDSRLSAFLIKPFAARYDISFDDYQTDQIKTFNDFFSRKIKEGLRSADPDPRHLIAPCDGLLSVYPIRGNAVFPVKQSSYTIASLLRDPALAARFEGGTCFVFRLCVNHYHRYVYADSGRKSENRVIPGRFHTVRPAALEQLPVFTENTREYTLIRSEVFGPLIQMEVGAMLVGRIVNHHGSGHVSRGEEKGMFQYGGSTVILLAGPEKVTVDPQILEASGKGIEYPVRLGQRVGEAAG